MKFSDKLKKMNACREAVKWVGKRGLMTAWRDCPRSDWMLWLAHRAGVDRKLLVLAACDCAETALKYIPEGENGPAEAIQVTRAWVAGETTIQEVHRARAAASAAAAAAAYAAIGADAASAAAAAAAYAAIGTDAAYAAIGADAAAAAAAIGADAAAAARNKAHKNNANLIRKRIPYSTIKEALE